MKVLIVGTGPVATSLAGVLAKRGGQLLGIWGRSPASVTKAASLAKVPALSGELALLKELDEAEVVVLAVSDDAIAEVARRVVATGRVGEAQVLVHCSGAVSAEQAFAEVSAKVGGVGLLHPLRAIVEPLATMEALPGTTFGIEGDSRGRRAAEELCALIGGVALPLRAEQMPGYHAAAVMASNYLVTLLDLANRLLEAEGIAPAGAGLLELAFGAISNVRDQGLPEALTGPIRRGDCSTVEGHMYAIDSKLPEASLVYRELAKQTLQIARKCGSARDSDLDEIKELLARPRG